MANTEPFNYDLDKITERETVFDFVSRLYMGLDFTNQDYNSGENSNDKQVILPKNIKLKDGVLMQIIRALSTSDKLHLNTLKTAYKYAAAGSTSVTILAPGNNYTAYKIIKESLGQDVLTCFTRSGNVYAATFDVPLTHDEYFKAYFY